MICRCQCTSIFVIFFFLLLSSSACRNNSRSASAGPVAAADAVSTFTLADGFQIEMIASEPLIFDPVDMEIDEKGRMYVVEMPGYPLDKSGSGKIILLADADGDGVMDKRTVYRDGLMLPTSIMRWKKGVIVTDAPVIIYFEDTDGDGQAEKSDTLLHGFALTNPQHNTNSPVYGIDNWIYVAHEGAVSTREYKEEFGDEGSEIIFYDRPGSPKLPKNANGRSLRFLPDKYKIEMTSSRCQFGHTFDQWGHRFACNNSNQGFHEVIANRYLERNIDLLVSEATHNMSDHLNAAEVFPTTINPDRQLLTDIGVMTSACGILSYQGNLFPAPYNNNVTFIAEPVSNLVHVDILKDSGASFTASRIFENREFLSSADSWSRPVNLYVGPDGALYVVDYYRRLIESPEWMSEEVIKAGGLYDGTDKGRIYRITPKGSKRAEWTKGLTLGDATAEDLVKNLSHPNNWWRMNAQRLLIDRANKTVIPALQKMSQSPESALGRLHALWTLEGLESLSADVIMNALKDTVAGVRENAIQLAEIHLAASPSLTNSLIAMQDDPDPKVRFQLLLTLGYVNSNESIAARNKILFSDVNDNWVQIAALTAPSTQSASMLNQVLNKFKEDVPAYATLVRHLTAMVGGSGSVVEVHSLIRKACGNREQPEPNASILSGLAEGLDRREDPARIGTKEQKILIQTFFEAGSDVMRQASLQLLKVCGISGGSQKKSSMQKAVALIKDTSNPANERAFAVDFISIVDPSAYADDLKKLLAPHENTSVQLAAVRTLHQIKGITISEDLIRLWPTLTPGIRDAAIPGFLADSQRTALLIDALEKDQIKQGSISFPQSVQMMQNNNENLRSRARAIFTKNEKEREKVKKEYQAVLDMDGNATIGKEIYVKNCAICHQLRGKLGVEIGPDLGTIHNWLKEDILANVIDPDISISSGFDLWKAELRNGEIVQGIIASETSSGLTLRNFGKQDRIINRQDVRSIKAMKMSAMPSGFEKSISQKEMADLLAFLRQN